MKNIDEAGVEWRLSHPEADKEETWKAGANYVLDIIQRFVIETHFNLEHIVKQLKK